jgi:pyruvate,water dikinase
VSAAHTRPLEELRRGDEPEFGGKSASLGELIASGIPVPPGFAVASSAFREFLEAAGLEEVVARALAESDPDDVSSLRSASAAIGDAIRGASLPEAIGEEVTGGYGELARAAGEDEPPVAVRSSAVGEDSAEATFAGQQETYLWVRGVERVCDAVRDCWASLYSPEAVSYRARMGGEAAPAMGVTVQRMVDAEVSGVLFTCNPVSGDPSVVAVNASWGLGTAVVGGEVTPDEYRISKVTGEVLHRAVSPKEVEYLPDPEGGGTRCVEVPADRREAACLEEGYLEALVELARRVEKHFGGHQDVEWAIARGEAVPEGLFVLQSRPVTTKRKKAEAPRKSALSLVMGTFGAEPADGS